MVQPLFSRAHPAHAGCCGDYDIPIETARNMPRTRYRSVLEHAAGLIDVYQCVAMKAKRASVAGKDDNPVTTGLGHAKFA